jgi:hypothetical protein
MFYFDGALSSMKPVIIKVTEDSLVIKEGTKGSFNAWYDTTKLAPLERFYYKLLEFHYPLSDTNIKSRRRKYYDSLLKIYPELNNPSYFKYLLDKSAVYGEKFSYKTTYRKISKEEYRHVVSLINNSEFWNCPYDCSCKDMPMDAAGFSLEANTPKKYNFITRPVCTNDSSKLISAVEELVRLAGLNNKIKVRWIESAPNENSVPIEAKPVELQVIKLEDIKPKE